MSAILKVENLNVTLRHRRVSKKLVEDVSFEVHPGECLGILGESGSGKSMTVKSVLGLLDKNFQVSGSAIFDGQDLLKETKEELRRLRGSRITMVLQNPMTCFDPLYRIGNQMAETFATHTSWNVQEPSGLPSPIPPDTMIFASVRETVSFKLFTISRTLVRISPSLKETFNFTTSPLRPSWYCAFSITPGRTVDICGL